ncbi:VOC family protein [Paraburkholderia oxyphila]|uniref:VOC family protein n=1 Tax=Paraburkholderia oxyphila TaxID=614212 RepID=UPI0004832A28|nr:VOC family protein [Paraburkholderia oxyphila]
MALHGISRIILGVPNVETTGEYYEAFGLAPLGEHRFGTVEGGHQLTLVETPKRQLKEICIGADAAEDLLAIGERLVRLDAPLRLESDALHTAEPVSGTAISVRIAPRIEQRAAAAPRLNLPGRYARPNERIDAFYRTGPVKPRKLGHVVLGSSNAKVTRAFFIDGLGFKASDTVNGVGTFMRCSTEHHNVFLLESNVDFMHHTGWQVEDVDEVGRGATHMIKRNGETHVWGLGRHYIGSNFFWYLQDPAGNFVEYYADMDHIEEHFGWVEGIQKTGLGWGLKPPHTFTNPMDLAGFEG